MHDTRSLKNSKKGKTALVLGTGPSLGRLNVEAVRRSDLDIWVVNSFALSSVAEEVCPNYYVLSDVSYFNSESEFQPIRALSKRCKFTFVIPHWVNRILPSNETVTPESIYFDDRELSAWTSNTEPTKPRGYLSLTLYKALSLVLHMGYNDVFLLGFDNTEFLGYTSDVENRFFFGGNHSYIDHHPHEMTDIFLDGPAGAFIDIAHALADLYKFNGPIINLDSKSLTTAFPKVKTHPWISP